jgi:putative inorganic carbon (hco3(-)) transporter
MARRAVWRPPWYAWALLALASLAAIDEATPRLLRGHWLILTPCLLLLAVLAIRRMWELPPAVTMCAAIALTIFAGGWSQMGLGGLPLDRLLIALVLLAVFLRAPGIAHTPRLQLRNVHLLMCLALVYVLASAAASGTLTTETGFLSLLDQFGGVPYLMFLLAPAIFAGRRERSLLLGTLVGLGAYLGVTAICESLGPHSLVFPSYIVRVDELLPEGRAGGPFQSSVAEGFATFACAVAAAIAVTQWRERRSRYFAAIVAAACMLGCFLTLERGVWVAAIAGITATALMTQTGRRLLLPGALACTLVIGAALLLSPALASRTSTRVGDQASVWARQDQTAAGLRMVAAKPLFGFGWGGFTSHSLEYFRQASDHPMTGYSQGGIETAERRVPLHDTYLSYAVELGLVGALLWLASLFWGVGGAIFSAGAPELRPWKLGLIAIAVFFLVVSVVNPYQGPFPVLLLWTWAGVALGSMPLPVQARRAATVRETRGIRGSALNGELGAV